MQFLHFQAPFCVESETAAARLIGTPHISGHATSWCPELEVSRTIVCPDIPDVSIGLGVGSGVVIAVPIPEELSAEGREVEEAIQVALQAAE